uniref:E3 ubiquitin-protein ligase MARCHF9-like n=1 Tax=Nyctereutes procyonoides TaxID=34880 RepID=UPI0024445FA3|nr:E3 ubiquitin-protein ligase MARCHF9-like [Nyctereutes procyonoides]
MTVTFWLGHSVNTGWRLTTPEQISTSICSDELHPTHQDLRRPPRMVGFGGNWDLYTEAAGRATPGGWQAESAPPGGDGGASLLRRAGGRETLERRGEKAEGCANAPRGGPARQAGAGAREPAMRPPPPHPPPPTPPRSREPPRVGSSLTAGCRSG